ncbi:hypothetical protein GGQ80_002094 [Sphingomonas jinjuensis]|uniref:Uncharacterized protein n=1 Tax=Sphingomonas jinjuensis TaxID=535907 RepID=A0A840FEM6_9SPHN|nr:hypothetical protein [Sphingomonas jinjuensis]MBB4154184.1 hypothetical protein [Sphingomonas jinjuensis]
MILLLLLTAAAGGQVDKFESRKPVADYVTSRKLEDVERCLIRFGSPPQVYRQPDLPDDAIIVWPASGIPVGNAAARVDLHRETAATTRIRSWFGAKVVTDCAPRGS